MEFSVALIRCLSIVLGLLSAVPASSSFNIKQEKHVDSSLLHRRVKRRPGDEGDFREGDMAINREILKLLEKQGCRRDCDKNFHGSMAPHLRTLQKGGLGNFPIPEVFQRSSFDWLCHHSRRHDTCLEACGLKTGFSSVNLVCKKFYREYISLFPCLRKAQPRLITECDIQQCPPYQHVGSGLVPSELSYKCRALKCDLGCQKGVLRRACSGREATETYEFLKKYVKEMLTTYQQILRDRERDSGRRVLAVIPDACLAFLPCNEFQ